MNDKPQDVELIEETKEVLKAFVEPWKLGEPCWKYKLPHEAFHKANLLLTKLGKRK